LESRELGYLNLALVKGIGPQTASALVERFGSIEAVMRASRAELARVPRVGPKLAAEIVNVRASDAASREIGLAEETGVHLLSIESPEYPEGLKYLHDPPIMLYMKGEWTREDLLAFAIVGSRRCSYYGRSQAERLAAALAMRGITVVSGLAAGIDSAAHRACLKAGGRTIAVLGSGLARIYPKHNVPLAEEVCEQGAIISEFPMRAAPEATNFPRRNRLISGLSLGVIIVEAGRRSGALITANWALEQGKEVFAVPGEAGSHLSKGTNQLIRTGAKLVEGVEDVLEEFPDIQEKLSGGDTMAEEGTPLRITGEERKVWNALGRKPVNIEDVITASGMSPQNVNSALMMLELKGLVRQLAGKMFVRRE